MAPLREAAKTTLQMLCSSGQASVYSSKILKFSIEPDKQVKTNAYYHKLKKVALAFNHVHVRVTAMLINCVTLHRLERLQKQRRL